MGNKVGTMQKPVIMTKSFLEEKIISGIALVEGLNISELQRLVKMDGIERNLVVTLQLEQQNLLNIGNLWKFTLLTKLDIANNYVEEIEGLETLSNLQNLDLSFNCIKKIKGLDGLINLEYLNLSYNEIDKLENLASLKKLETLVVRHNKIKAFENIYYLAQFENLFCFAIDENPVMLTDNAKLHILAVLPQLKFLDFIMVTENELQDALLHYPAKSQTSESKLFESCSGKSFSFLWKTNTPDKEAFVDGLANGRGFEVLLENDRNFLLLHSFPPAATIAKNHRKELGELFDDWHAKGQNYYKQMQEEKANLCKMIKEAEKFATNVSEEEEYSYITFIMEKSPNLSKKIILFLNILFMCIVDTEAKYSTDCSCLYIRERLKSSNRELYRKIQDVMTLANRNSYWFNYYFSNSCIVVMFFLIVLFITLAFLFWKYERIVFNISFTLMPTVEENRPNCMLCLNHQAVLMRQNQPTPASHLADDIHTSSYTSASSCTSSYTSASSIYISAEDIEAGGDINNLAVRGNPRSIFTRRRNDI